MNPTIELSITDNSKEILQAEHAAVERFLNEAGLHLSGQAQLELENDPRRVDTGRLRNSISYATSENNGARPAPPATAEDSEPRSTPEKNTLYVGTNVEYGIYVHEGTQRMAPNRFLRNAFDRNEEQVQQKLKEALTGG